MKFIYFYNARVSFVLFNGWINPLTSQPIWQPHWHLHNLNLPKSTKIKTDKFSKKFYFFFKKHSKPLVRLASCETPTINLHSHTVVQLGFGRT